MAIKHREVISEKVMTNQDGVFWKPRLKRVSIREIMLLSCDYVLDTDAPEACGIFEEVVRLNVTRPVLVGGYEILTMRGL